MVERIVLEALQLDGGVVVFVDNVREFGVQQLVLVPLLLIVGVFPGRVLIVWVLPRGILIVWVFPGRVQEVGVAGVGMDRVVIGLVPVEVASLAQRLVELYLPVHLPELAEYLLPLVLQTLQVAVEVRGRPLEFL